jgi:lipopolysaccharide transport system ATP-binding protein
VASLLEVGTGFHPELTGRENIFLNGAILGMSRAEINRKFDEIVEFAEITRFLDTPVKRYSSGMYVRLAFAVAAHLEPEILVVDEVLAVGDVLFQKKCLGKMKSISTEGGRTVLFVSHNMAAIRRLCAEGIALEKGEVRASGEVCQVVEKHLNILERKQSTLSNANTNNCIFDAFIASEKGIQKDILDAKEASYLKLKVNSNVGNLNLGLTIFNSEDVGIFSGITSDTFPSLPMGNVNLRIRIPSEILNAGLYRVEYSLYNHEKIYDSGDCLISFQVMRDNDFEARGGKPLGLLRLSSPWIIENHVIP